MSKTYIQIGTYNDLSQDHSKHVTVNVPPGTNPADLIRAFMAENAEDIPSSPTSNNRSEKESRLKLLFDDTQRTTEECNRFMNYITDHKLNQTPIDSSQDNPILKAVVCFCAKWKSLRFIESDISPKAVLRFLTVNCELKCDNIDEKAIRNTLARMIRKGYDQVLFGDVCDYF